MNIVLSSTNKAKIAATEKVFSTLYDDINIDTVDVNSEVSATPDTDDEGITGCLNRIRNAEIKNPGKDIYVGLEGIITKNKFGVYLCGWAVIKDTTNNKTGSGCSAKVQIPGFIARNIQSFNELSTLIKENYPSELITQMSEIGSNGIITEGLYTRVDEFEDALQCALGFIHNKTNFS